MHGTRVNLIMASHKRRRFAVTVYCQMKIYTNNSRKRTDGITQFGLNESSSLHLMTVEKKYTYAWCFEMLYSGGV